MLRLSMSEQGPRTLSNRCLSRRTHFRGPLAITVAALGLSSRSAISPANRTEHSHKPGSKFDT